MDFKLSNPSNECASLVLILKNLQYTWDKKTIDIPSYQFIQYKIIAFKIGLGCLTLMAPVMPLYELTSATYHERANASFKYACRPKQEHTNR